MDTLKTTTTARQKEEAFRLAVSSHAQLRRSFNHPTAKWRRYFEACAATRWTRAPAEMRGDIRAWQCSSPMRNSAVAPMRYLETVLY